MITPCISICKIDRQTKVCQGCGRTNEEIKMWSKYTDEQRMEVMRRLGYGTRSGRQKRYDNQEKRRK